MFLFSGTQIFYLALGVAAIGWIAYLIIGIVNAKSLARMIRSAQRTTIAKCAHLSYARVKGIVLPDKVLCAPLSGRDCVYYSLEIAIWDEGVEVGSWMTVVDKINHDRFSVVDASGVAEILTHNAVFESHQIEQREAPLADLPESIQQQLRLEGIDSEMILPREYVIVTEGIIAPGDTVWAQGVPRHSGEGEVTLASHGRYPLVITDGNDGALQGDFGESVSLNVVLILGLAFIALIGICGGLFPESSAEWINRCGQ